MPIQMDVSKSRMAIIVPAQMGMVWI